MRPLIVPWLQRIQHRLRKWALDTRTISGFTVEVENHRVDIQTDAVATKLKDAFELIERCDPRMLRRIRRDIARFWVVRYPTRGAYFPAQRVCMIELTFLASADFSPAQIAACIIHEGAHARLRAAGVKTATLPRGREERFCRKAELVFAASLPVELARPVIERAQEAILGSDEDAAPQVDWKEAFRRQREVDVQSARQPRWLKRARLARIARERDRASGAD